MGGHGSSEAAKRPYLKDKKVGTGVAARRGDRVTIRYSGSLNRGEVFQKDVITEIMLGKRRVIAGLERGLIGMRVGGVRTLRVGPHLAFRDVGVPGIVPPNAVFSI